MLEGFKLTAAWIIVLRKRDAFRRAFANFDPVQVAAFGHADDIEQTPDRCRNHPLASQD